ncbi:hypothetical protein Mapa_007483 [Marchantia paleacea]|nr:hypothetical protein Mapa_007483 [Marchantia paleacea]
MSSHPSCRCFKIQRHLPIRGPNTRNVTCRTSIVLLFRSGVYLFSSAFNSLPRSLIYILPCAFSCYCSGHTTGAKIPKSRSQLPAVKPGRSAECALRDYGCGE